MTRTTRLPQIIASAWLQVRGGATKSSEVGKWNLYPESPKAFQIVNLADGVKEYHEDTGNKLTIRNLPCGVQPIIHIFSSYLHHYEGAYDNSTRTTFKHKRYSTTEHPQIYTNQQRRTRTLTSTSPSPAPPLLIRKGKPGAIEGSIFAVPPNMGSACCSPVLLK